MKQENKHHFTKIDFNENNITVRSIIDFGEFIQNHPALLKLNISNISTEENISSFFIYIKDFKINLYECKNGHEIKNILLNEFDETQSIELDKIICDTCKIKDKSKTYNNEFFKCLKCNKNLCPLCKSKHDNKHEIIDYDDHYYICENHNKNYGAYCENCKKNLCLSCSDHEKHLIIKFDDIKPNIENLIDKKE